MCACTCPRQTCLDLVFGGLPCLPETVLPDAVGPSCAFAQHLCPVQGRGGGRAEEGGKVGRGQERWSQRVGVTEGRKTQKGEGNHHKSCKQMPNKFNLQHSIPLYSPPHMQQLTPELQYHRTLKTLIWQYALWQWTSSSLDPTRNVSTMSWRGTPRSPPSGADQTR